MHFSLVSSLDIIGALFSLLSTALYIRASNHAWPAAIIAFIVNLTLYTKTGLYADAGKESLYLISSFLGWYWWSRTTPSKKLVIRNLKIKEGLLIFSIAASSIILLAFTLIHFTNSKVPYWDATTTILSLTAQWLICRKIIECWILWFVVDALYAGLYFFKGLPAHGYLLCAYTILAIIGYAYWFAQSRGTKYRSYNRASSVPDSGL